MKKKLFLFLLGVLITLPSFARDFSYEYEGQILNYTVLDEDAKTVETKAGVFGPNDLYPEPGNHISGALIIPEVVKDGDEEYTVIGIGDSSFFGNGITSIELPKTLTYINGSAFIYCPVEAVTYLTTSPCEYTGCFKKPILYILMGCASIFQSKGWNLPMEEISTDNVVEFNYLYQGVTLNCLALVDDGTCVIRKVVQPETISGNFIIPSALTYNGVDYIVTVIGESAFSDCAGMTSVEIPNSVMSIGREAFSYCSSLTSVEIPNSVTSIGEMAFYGCSSLTSAEIPNSVTSIGEMAFYGCSSLTSVEIPNSVTSIGDMAFTDCSSLKTVVVGSSVELIGSSAFEGCTEIETITCLATQPCWINGGAFSEETYSNATLIVPDGCKGNYLESQWQRFRNIEDNTVTVDYIHEGKTLSYFVMLNDARTCSVSRCDNEIEGDVIIPSTITYEGVEYTVISIGESAFENCSALTSVEIPNSVTSIGGYAFNGCNSLTSVLIPNSVTSIGESAFENCSALTSVEIPNSVTSIGGYAFNGCNSLTSVLIPNSVTSIGEWAFFYCSNLISVEIPNSVTSIEIGTFQHCRSLTSVSIPNSVTSIGGGAFYGCPLSSFYIPKDIELGEGVVGTDDDMMVTEVIVEEGRELVDLNWFHSLKSLKLPDSVTTLNEGGECKIGRYEIGNGLTSIPENAFSNTTAVFISSPNPPTLDSEVFGSNDPLNILAVVPYEAKAAYRANEMWSRMTILDEVTGAVTVNLDGTESLSVALYNQTGTMPVNVLKLKITGEITEDDWEQFRTNMIHCIELDLSEAKSDIFPNLARNGSLPFECQYFPQGVKTVNYHTTPVVKTIPETVEVIGDWAFADAIFEGDITLPAGVRSIGGYAFANTELTEVQIPEVCEYIGNGCFSNTPLATIRIPDLITNIPYGCFENCRNLLSVTLGKGVRGIGDNAFSGTSITSIELPATVSEIGGGAFQGTPLTWITSLNTVPPTLSEDFNTAMNYQKCVLSIPSDSFFDYLQASVWGRFAVLDGRLDYTSGPGVDTSCSQTYGSSESEKPCRAAAEDAEADNMMQVVSGQAILLDDGSVLRFKISPVGNTKIVKVLFNDEDVTDKLVDGYYTTPAISGRASLKVESEGVDVEAPEVPVAKVGETILSTSSTFESTEAVDVVLSCATEGAKIYYLFSTAEAVEPAEEAEYTLYTEPVKVVASGSLSVYAELDGVKSEISTYVIEIKPNGVAMTIADLENAEVYSLQGMRVAHPEAGQIYIIRQGGRTFKAIVR